MLEYLERGHFPDTLLAQCVHVSEFMCPVGAYKSLSEKKANIGGPLPFPFCLSLLG